MNISNDLLEFIRLLNERKVEYLIVGGWAFSLLAKPRYTKDIDIFINRDRNNALRMMDVIRDFGFGSLEISEDDFLKENFIIQLGNEPNRIDILTSLRGISFTEEWTRRLLVEYESLSLSVICREGLIKNKKAVARDQDLVDVKLLEKLTKNT